MAEVKERYECGKCGYLYIDFDEAVACCGGDEPVLERCKFTLELPL